MVRALWFATKLALITLAAVWVANRPGYVFISWLDYDIRVHIGFALLSLLILAILYKEFLGLLALPKNWRRYALARRERKGQRALLHSLSAIAAGDGHSAMRHASRARRLLPKDSGMTLFVEAQAARLKGQGDRARIAYSRLMQQKETAFLGLRGLMTAAIEDGHMVEALSLARRAQDMYPKQAWVLRLVYDLQLRQSQWDDAFNTLRRIEKLKALPQADITSDRQAILLQQADNDLENGLEKPALHKMKKAYKLDAGFIPGAIRLAEALIRQGYRKAAVKVIEKAWAQEPHAELAALWLQAAPRSKPSDVAARMRWFEKLVALRPDSDESQLAVAEVAIDDRLWGEARPYLTRAENIRQSARLYRLWARMEEEQGHAEQARHYLLKAADAAADPVWTCRETGHIYERWSPVALPHGSFNTIVWDFPQRIASRTLPLTQDMLVAPPVEGAWHTRIRA